MSHLVFGRRIPELAGAEEDSAMLAAVVADAQATQSIHKEILQHLADWETRQPGVINADDDLRNTFISNLEGLRSAFTDRSLQTVGVMFPASLDRSNPAHAVILAVRDDIADSRDRIQAGKAQELVGKQVAAAKITLPEYVAQTAAKTAADAAAALKAGAQAGGKAVENFASTLAWIVGGGFILYLMTGGHK
jgi:hypothetical protein